MKINTTILCILLAFSLALPAGIASRDNGNEKSGITGNLLPNPSFEEGGDKPSGWEHKAMCGTGKYLWDSNCSQDGEKSVGMLNVVGGCSDSAYWYTIEMIPVDPINNTYTASVWYEFRGEKERCPTIYMRVVTYDKDKYHLSTLDISAPYEDNDWHYVEHVYDAGNDTSSALPVGTRYVKISLCAIVEWNQNADAEVRFDSVFFGVKEYANTPPGAPDISGPTSGKAGEEYGYTFISIDPDGDDVYYQINWGDGCADKNWYGPYASGEMVTFNHTWENEGDYNISAMARDTHNDQSEWGMLEVSMPKIYTYGLIERIMEWIFGMIYYQLF